MSFHPEHIRVALSAGPVQDHVSVAALRKGVSCCRRNIQGVFPGSQAVNSVESVRVGFCRGGNIALAVLQRYLEAGNLLFRRVRR